MKIMPGKESGGLPLPEGVERQGTLLECSNDALFLLNPAHDRIIDANLNASALFGFQPEEFLATPIFRLCPEDLGKFQAFVQRVADQGLGWTDELACRAKDGRLVATEMSASTIVRDGVIHILVIVRDVTAREQAEEERRSLLLREREARGVAEALNEVSCAIAAELDIHTLLQKVTDASTRLTGAKFGAFFYNVRNEQGDASMLYGLSGAPREAFEKFGLPRHTPLFGPTSEGVGVVRIDDVVNDPRYGTMPPHGMPKTDLPVRSYLAVPVMARSGDVSGGLFFGHPEPGVFTERHERLIIGLAAQAAIAMDNARLYGAAQREIARSQQQRRLYETILSNTPDLAYVIGLDHRFIYANQALLALWGRTWDEAIGKNLLELGYEPWHAALHDREIEQVVATKQPLRGEVPFTGTPGRRIYDYIFVPVLGSNGEVEAVAGTTRDVTERKQAEEQLRDIQARLDATLTAAEIATWTWDIQNDRMVADRNLARLFSATPEEAAGAPIASYIRAIHPEDWPRVEEAVTQALEQGGPYEMEYRLVQPGGSYRWVVARGKVEYDAGGKPIRFPGVIIDITERKRAENEVHKFKFLSDHASEAHHLVDRQARFVYGNKVALERLGYTEAEFLRLSVPDIDPIFTREKMDALFEAAQRGQAPPFESIHIRKDGSTFPIEVSVTVVNLGGELFMSALIRDITERKRQEAALRESEAYFRELAEKMPQIVWTNLPDGRVDWVNRQWLDYTGQTLEYVQSRPEAWMIALHPDDRGYAERSYMEGVRSGRGFTMEARFRRASDGAYRWFLNRALPVHDAAGTIIKFLGACTDIDDQKRAEAQLRSFAAELEQAVEERTNELTQSQAQLRALATELNLTELKERKRLAVELHDHLAQMLVLCRLKLGQSRRIPGLVEDCQHLIKQTEDVLDEALTYTRTLVAELAPPVLHDFGLPAALKWLAAYMERHELAVTLSLPDDPHLALPEDQAVLLFQSARELLMNASKHAQTGAASLSLSEQNGVLHIEIRDEGKGMDPLAAQSASMSSKFGLFSIRERMRAMGGACEIESAPGQGTTARLVLPLGGHAAETLRLKGAASHVEEASKAGHPSRLTPHASRPSPSGNASRVADHGSLPAIRVLLVDDHAMVREGLRTVLDGYPDLQVVGEAANGVEAVELAETLKPAVIVMDINMPRMNGIEATAAIKDRSPDIIVIGLSVNAQGENQEAMTKAGASLLLTKEAAVDELYRTIQDLLLSHGR